MPIYKIFNFCIHMKAQDYIKAISSCVSIRVGPDTFLAGYRIPDIRLIIYSGYPALTGYPADYRISGRITGYCGKKQTFYHKIFGAIPYYALGAQIPPLYLIFFVNKEMTFCFVVYMLILGQVRKRVRLRQGPAGQEPHAGSPAWL